MIKAISKLKENAIFCIIGKGPLKKELINYAENLGVSNRFIIKENVNNAKEVISAFDVFVLSSVHEGMSNALLEAMASKVAVIVSDIDENKELVQNEVNGLTFKVGDSESLLKKLKDKNKFTDKAKKNIINKYSIGNVIEEYETIIRGVL